MSSSKNRNLKTPNEEQAKKDLSKCNYEDRLIGSRMHPMAGNQRKPLHSLRDVYNFLEVEEDKEKLLKKGTGASINYVNPETVANWIEDIYDDEELSKKIKTEIEEENNYIDKVKVVKQLIGKRIHQCGEVLEED